MSTFLAITVRTAGSMASVVSVERVDDLEQAAARATEGCYSDWLVAGVVEADHAVMVADALYRFAG